MKLYAAPLSLFSRKVEIALREKGLACERVMVPFSQERGYAPKHPDVLAANPKGQVPVLVDGALTLLNSTVILEYLEDAYPDPPLYPTGARARAECRLLELFADEVLLVDIRRLMYRSEPPAGDPRAPPASRRTAARGEAALRRRWAELEPRLAAAPGSAAASPRPTSRCSWPCCSPAACTGRASMGSPRSLPGLLAPGSARRSSRPRPRSRRPTSPCHRPSAGSSRSASAGSGGVVRLRPADRSARAPARAAARWSRGSRPWRRR